MRRLIAWIAILASCASLFLIGVRVLRSAPASTACVQLLSPTTGDVLTVDATTGAAQLDSRIDFPLPIVNAPYRALLSPDKNLVVDAVNIGEIGPDAFRLWLGRRSTTAHRELTQQSHAHQYVWSPNSQYLAFIEMRSWNAQGMQINLAVADANGQLVQREPIPDRLDNSWFGGTREVSWSPASSTVALALYRVNVGATLVLRPSNADHSIFVSFPNERIGYFVWSPTGQYIYVITEVSAAQYKLYVVQPDGHIYQQSSFAPNFIPLSAAYAAGTSGIAWSPDDQYFYVLNSDFSAPALEVFSLDGDRLLATPLKLLQLSASPGLWMKQPHTLRYFQRDPDGVQQSLVALDVQTGQRTKLLAGLSSSVYVNMSFDAAAMLIYDYRDDTHTALHLVSQDLTRNEMPFGIIESQNQLLPNWSPDSQKVLLVRSAQSEFHVIWWNMSTGEIKQVDIPKSATPNEQMFASWLTDERILLVKNSTAGSTMLLLDPRTMQFLPKFSLPITTEFGYSIAWHDDHYAAISTNTSMSLYRLSDGSTAFDNLAPGAGPGAGTVTFAVEPNERALLIYRDRDSNFTRPTLSLITDNLRRIVMNADFVTLPAWSSDGELFTFAAIEKFKAGWTVKLMSRDGKLLHSFPLPAETSNTPYQQARWTNCN